MALSQISRSFMRSGLRKTSKGGLSDPESPTLPGGNSQEAKKRFVVRLLPLQEVEESGNLSSSARRRAEIRATPVLDSHYLPVWKRVRAKLKSQYMVKRLRVDLNLYGSAKAPTPTGSEDPFATFQLAASRYRTENYFVPREQGPRVPWYILHPDHKPRRRWDLAMSAVLIYTATIMPYRLAFENIASEFWTGLESTVMALFLLDLCINFLTAFYNADGELVHNLLMIARHYAAGWLVVDLVACVPFNMIVSGDTTSSNSGYSNILKLVRVPQLYRLLRLSRLLKTLKSSDGCLSRLQDYFSLKSSALRLFSFFVSMLTGVHLMACLWCFLPSLEANPTQSWIFVHDLQDSEDFSIYIAAFYWAITTLTTVGYGDISAHTSLEKLVAVGWMVFGIFFFSFTIGSLTAMVTTSDTHEAILTQKIALMDEFSKYAHLSPDLRTRLKHALSYSSSRTGFSWADRRVIFSELPKDLKYEVAMMMHQGSAAHVQFFEKREREFLAEVVPFLVPVLVEAQEYVYRVGEHASEMYFLIIGRCVVNACLKGEFVQVRVIPSGAHFGELDVINGTPRQYEVQALQQSHLLTLSKPLLRDIQQDYPKTYAELVVLAEMRKELYQRLVSQMRQAKEQKGQETLKRAKTSELVDMRRLNTMEVPQNSPRLDLASSVAASTQRLEELSEHVEGVKRLLRTQFQDLVGLLAEKPRC